MKKLYWLMPTIAALFIIMSLCACSSSGGQQGETPAPDSGALTISFDYEKQSGHASNQFAVWIEDADGVFIKTLYATKFTANGGFGNRPSLPAWTEKSGVASMQKSEVDAITGATPKAGTLAYTWDLTDTNGDTVPPGEYRFIVEGSLRWENRILYSGVIMIGDAPDTAEASAEFIFKANEQQAALSDNSPEKSMIGVVTASFIPAAAAS